MLRIQKEFAVCHTTFVGQLTMLYEDFVYALIHIGAMIFCTYNQTISSINNINEISQ